MIIKTLFFVTTFFVASLSQASAPTTKKAPSKPHLDVYIFLKEEQISNEEKETKPEYKAYCSEPSVNVYIDGSQLICNSLNDTPFSAINIINRTGRQLILSNLQTAPR